MRSALVLVTLVIVVCAAFAAQAIKIVANGRTVKSDPAPFIQDGHVYVPLRAAGQALGVNVTYHADTKIIRLCTPTGAPLGNSNSSCKLIYQNEGITREGRFFLGIRKLAESLGSKVTWDSANRTIRIRTAPPALDG